MTNLKIPCLQLVYTAAVVVPRPGVLDYFYNVCLIVYMSNVVQIKIPIRVKKKKFEKLRFFALGNPANVMDL